VPCSSKVLVSMLKLMDCHASFKDQLQVRVIVKRNGIEILLFCNSCRKFKSLRKDFARLDITVNLKGKSRRGDQSFFYLINYSINK